MSFQRALDPILADFKARQPIRAKSLIITLFGDVVSQHGKEIWLGSLIHALDELGVNDRLVRTSVFRLVKEGWLSVEREGRRSFYQLTSSGGQEYQRAAQRIYASQSDIWRGRWQILLPVNVPDEKRENFRRSLNWLGFRAISSGTFARPGGDAASIRDVLDEFDLKDGVIVMDAETNAITTKQDLKETVNHYWDLDQLALRYNNFVGQFKPLLQAVEKGRDPTPINAFHARLLLIHEYRRILLRDTPLPDDLLPAQWPGTAARAMVGRIYRGLQRPSLEFVQTELTSRQGTLPKANKTFFERFE
jgi:phenylacetic acid degradation operon negative regulatory protein